MREIIFRGKRLDNGEWVYGSLFVGFQKSYICPEAIAMYNFDGALCIGGFIEVYPSTVGQYTGLKDKHGKNGKRIFEGDILSFRAGRTHVVRFEDGAFILEDSAIPIPFAIKSEIIGNVHDNPELLKEEAQP